MTETVDPTCGVAHGAPAPEVTGRVLVAVFASPVAEGCCAGRPSSATAPCCWTRTRHGAHR
ncbi:hypothetical protein [Blastococcus sp. SYSU D00695]